MGNLMTPVVTIQPKQPEKVSGQKWHGLPFGQCGSMKSRKLIQKLKHIKSSLLIAQNNPEKQKDCCFSRLVAYWSWIQWLQHLTNFLNSEFQTLFCLWFSYTTIFATVRPYCGHFWVSNLSARKDINEATMKVPATPCIIQASCHIF